MKAVFDLITRNVGIVAPTDSIGRALHLMNRSAIDALAVCDGARLLGMVTTRDIDAGPDEFMRIPLETPVEDVMAEAPPWCFADLSVDDAMQALRDVRSGFVAAVDRQMQLVGFVSVTDLIASHTAESVNQSSPQLPPREGPYSRF